MTKMSRKLIPSLPDIKNVKGLHLGLCTVSSLISLEAGGRVRAVCSKTDPSVEGQSTSQLRRTNPLHLPINLANPGGQSFERVTALRQLERKIKTILAPKLKMERVACWCLGCFVLDFLEGEGRARKGWLSVAIHSQFKINASDFLRGGED